MTAIPVIPYFTAGLRSHRCCAAALQKKRGSKTSLFRSTIFQYGRILVAGGSTGLAVHLVRIYAWSLISGGEFAHLFLGGVFGDAISLLDLSVLVKRDP
jgi:hypothetical protein